MGPGSPPPTDLHHPDDFLHWMAATSWAISVFIAPLAPSVKCASVPWRTIRSAMLGSSPNTTGGVALTP
jgi:hypothetical protein